MARTHGRPSSRTSKATRSGSGGSDAAVGLRAHSGWATMIAVAGPPAAPAVLLRRRVELSADDTGSRQPFHAAEGMELEKAEDLIRRSTDAARKHARDALAGAVAELRQTGHAVVGCGLLTASSRPLPALARILASHALIHAAKGELFRDALLAAARGCGLEVLAVKEKEVMDRGAAMLRISGDEAKRRLSLMGRALGPPWRQDEKLSALVAWLSLVSTGRAADAS